MLASLPFQENPNLLVGMETADDAGVFRLNDETALVVTADFITPPVDDPYTFGQVAAANALSDIYAMGAKPVTALNLAGFPSGQLPLEMLERIIAGALSKIHEAGAVLAGGHTTEDDEPKFGLSVTGLIHPDKIWRNVGAKVGDRLILTKPVGSGVLFNANQKGWVSAEALESCLEIIITLNKRAAEVMAEFEIHACTDVTGFGLAGHAYEMAKPSEVSFLIDLDALPVMDEALKMYKKGMTTGVNLSNRANVHGQVRFERDWPTKHKEIVYDPQTSGGLLAAVPEAQAKPLLDALHEGGVAAAVGIGEVWALDGEPLIFR